MSANQQDYRARGEERPLFPRLLRHPIQTPYIPPAFLSIAFIAVAAFMLGFGLLMMCKYNTRKQCSFKIFIKILATLACAAALGFGFYTYFINEQYDMGQNTLIAAGAALLASVLLL
ncbi:Transmembrane_domain-containing protein [Hexamita inflata]|uniref:Transmembrane domain-containing protein n=1 Tax=Hexamita inflata TaxID=28002 RepID=A0AA86TF51_9EUKA|nr:Transmembrane domain-containing protein [Hexamita inflata]CAI9916966.1 Transmembrane domain-containing protein [Hexamita inflata]CAI9945548.1 Transmembrane domain-containing protein [Hexamita inflata]CAI9965061.1 Transmembrane domain-containing protein [Hexamita inflata]